MDLADVDMGALRKTPGPEKLGPVMVEQTLRAWNMLIFSIRYLPGLT